MTNRAAGGVEAMEDNDPRVVTGVPIAETSAGVGVDGVVVVPPWKISVIGDADRLSDIADLMSQQLRADRRVRRASPPPGADGPRPPPLSGQPLFHAGAGQNRSRSRPLFAACASHRMG